MKKGLMNVKNRPTLLRNYGNDALLLIQLSKTCWHFMKKTNINGLIFFFNCCSVWYKSKGVYLYIGSLSRP